MKLTVTHKDCLAAYNCNPFGEEMEFNYDKECPLDASECPRVKAIKEES